MFKSQSQIDTRVGWFQHDYDPRHCSKSNMECMQRQHSRMASSVPGSEDHWKCMDWSMLSKPDITGHPDFRHFWVAIGGIYRLLFQKKEVLWNINWITPLICPNSCTCLFLFNWALHCLCWPNKKKMQISCRFKLHVDTFWLLHGLNVRADLCSDSGLQCTFRSWFDHQNAYFHDPTHNHPSEEQRPSSTRTRPVPLSVSLNLPQRSSSQRSALHL